MISVPEMTCLVSLAMSLNMLKKANLNKVVRFGPIEVPNTSYKYIFYFV